MATQIEKQSTAKGGKRPGAGRPKGSVNLNKREFLDRVQAAVPEVVNVLLDIVRDDTTDPGTKVRAIDLILNRAWGRPRTETDDAPEPTTLPAELIAALKR